MKYIVILGDGMADYPIASLGNKTALEAARKPYMDSIANKGVCGLAKTVPDDLPPGSDVANLSVLGYDPHLYYTGRSPLEAASMGVTLGDNDMAFRTNLVSLSGEGAYEGKQMLDYSAGEISSEEARGLIQDVSHSLGSGTLNFYHGVSYRHLLVWRGCNEFFTLTPPHDISGKQITNYLPSSDVIKNLMLQSYDVLKDHPINILREKNGRRRADSIWIWGQGTKPNLPPFYEKYKIKGAVISAVDLIKGIAICGKMQSIDVEGATGNIDTNYGAKAAAALRALRDNDFVYVHIEAPDECGHRFEVDNKVRAIELIDDKIIRPIFDHLISENIDFSMLVTADHPTPVSLGTHTRDAVPYAIYRSGDSNQNGAFSEQNAKGGRFIKQGHTLLDFFISS